MSFDFNLELVAWSKSLMSVGRKFQTNAKAIQKLTTDPFAALKQINKVVSILTDLGIPDLAPPSEVIEGIKAECLTQEAEFWGRLKEASHSEGWELIGSTNRRLLHRGIFIEITFVGRYRIQVRSLVTLLGMIRPMG